MSELVNVKRVVIAAVLVVSTICLVSLIRDCGDQSTRPSLPKKCPVETIRVGQTLRPCKNMHVVAEDRTSTTYDVGVSGSGLCGCTHYLVVTDHQKVILEFKERR